MLVRHLSVPLRGLKQSLNDTVTERVQRQASKRPAEGIETMTPKGWDQILSRYVRHLSVPLRGLKLFLQRLLDHATLRQASKRPAEGIETNNARAPICLIMCQASKRPAEGIETKETSL